MGETISIRFDEQTREELDYECAAQGIGISTLVRRLAEAELARVRRGRIHAEARSVTEYLDQHPTAFDDDDPSDWFMMPVEVISALLEENVGHRVRIQSHEASRPEGTKRRLPGWDVLEGTLIARVTQQGNRFAVDDREKSGGKPILISLENVKSVRRIVHGPRASSPAEP